MRKTSLPVKIITVEMLIRNTLYFTINSKFKCWEEVTNSTLRKNNIKQKRRFMKTTIFFKGALLSIFSLGLMTTSIKANAFKAIPIMFIGLEESKEVTETSITKACLEGLESMGEKDTEKFFKVDGYLLQAVFDNPDKLIDTSLNEESRADIQYVKGLMYKIFPTTSKKDIGLEADKKRLKYALTCRGLWGK